MSKFLIIGLIATATVAGATSLYYVSPLSEDAWATPPILIDQSPKEAMKVLEKINLATLSNFVPETKTRDEDISVLGGIVSIDANKVSENETNLDVKIDKDHFLQFNITLRPAGNKKTELDLQVIMPENRFSKNPNLDPADVKYLTQVLDYVVTDYISSLLKGHPPLIAQKTSAAFKKKFGMDGHYEAAMAARMKAAFEGAYKEAFLAQIEPYLEERRSRFDSNDDFADAGDTDGWDEDELEAFGAPAADSGR
jgi:hypothetical protein